jgi:hypothetical protein
LSSWSRRFLKIEVGSDVEWSTKLTVGSVLAILGGLGMAVGPLLGLTDLGRPLSFLAGFMIGVVAGGGAALAISGLIDRGSGPL